MHEFSLEYLRCVKCSGKLELDIFDATKEINEGFLTCKKCNHMFPIILKIPILWKSLESYFSERSKLGKLIHQQIRSPKLKSFIKNSLAKNSLTDRSEHEKHWAQVYSSSKDSKFYSKIKQEISRLDSEVALEHGCSIGIISRHLSKFTKYTFGIDRSFSALFVAKTTFNPKLDYFVADSLNHPFGNKKFDTIVGLNLLEIIEPHEFLSILSKQVKKTLILADPYDNKRGLLSVKNPVESDSLRLELEKHDFQISKHTKQPSFIPWGLKINDRTEINYKVDIVLATR